jgi:hypothetical protein
MNNKAKGEKIRAIKRSVSAPKSELLRVVNRLDEVSPREGERLMRIIARLETWQNS